MSGLWISLSLWITAATISLPAAPGDVRAVWISAALLGAGILLAAGWRARKAAGPWSPACLSLFLPLLVAPALLDGAGRWACLAAGVGLLLRVAAGSRRWPAALSEGMLGAALTVTLCSGLAPLYTSATARLVGWEPLATLLQCGAALAGWDARANGAGLVVADADTVYQHALAPAGIMPLPLAALAVTALLGSLVAPAASRSARILRTAALLAALSLFAVARTLVLVRLTIEGFGADLFWHPVALAISTLLAAPVLAVAAGKRPCSVQRAACNVKEPVSGHVCERPTAVTLHAARCTLHGLSMAGPLSARALLLVLTATTAAGLAAWSAAGTPKAGRLLIDESHSEWSRSGRPFDTNWFGMEATYNYASFAEYLAHYFPVSVNERAPLTRELLATCDILLLKMPTRPLAAAERAAVAEFVRRGGGLWLIGDHTNVFGSSTHLNAVCSEFGIRFRPDATWDLTTGGPALWQQAVDRSGHPVTRGMRRFEFQTGCSLAVSPGVEGVMVSPGIISRSADYGTPNYFPQARPNNYGGVFGPAVLAAAARHGAGRVVAFTDSTVFSTFSMFASGRPELAVNTVAWLNRRNRSPWPARLATLLAVVIALGLLAGARQREDAAARWSAVSLVLTALLGGAALARGLAADAAPAPAVRPEAPLRRVYFLATGSRALFENLDPLFWNVSDDPERERRFTTFLVGTQRFGLVPTVVEEVPDCRPEGDLLVMVLPEGPLPAPQAARLTRFVENGGRILLLPEAGSDEASLDALLRPLGLHCSGRAPGEQRMTVPGARLQMDLHDPMTFAGGAALGRDTTGRPILSSLALGRGQVIVLGDGGLFANARLGNHFDVPSGASRNAMALQFWLFQEHLLAGRQVTRRFPERLGADGRQLVACSP